MEIYHRKKCSEFAVVKKKSKKLKIRSKFDLRTTILKKKYTCSQLVKLVFYIILTLLSDLRNNTTPQTAMLMTNKDAFLYAKQLEYFDKILNFQSIS